MVSLVVPYLFRGPARSGNGGWTAGAYAELLAPGTVGPVAARVEEGGVVGQAEVAAEPHDGFGGHGDHCARDHGQCAGTPGAEPG